MKTSHIVTRNISNIRTCLKFILVVEWEHSNQARGIDVGQSFSMNHTLASCTKVDGGRRFAVRPSRDTWLVIFYVTLFLGGALYWNWIDQNKGCWELCEIRSILYFLFPTVLFPIVSLFPATAIVFALKLRGIKSSLGVWGPRIKLSVICIQSKSFHLVFTITYVILNIWLSYRIIP